jgi:hypothetical protein
MFISLKNLPMRVFNKVKSVALPYLLIWVVKLKWVFKRLGRPHGLPAPLIVSLTSYPARFPTLPLTLKCLLSQTVNPDRVILWIAHEDKDALTTEIHKLRKDGLEVKFCEDLKSYKKIIPTLKLEPGAFIVTADDDTYYPSTWLEEFVVAFNDDVKDVLCQRSHQIRLNEEGNPRPYVEWDYVANKTETSSLSLPTGNGGILYPPGIFHPDVLKAEIFNELCPRADDVWLYWMVRLEGGKYRKVGPERVYWAWPDSQSSALWLGNVTTAEGGNDSQIQAMVEKFGFPHL